MNHKFEEKEKENTKLRETIIKHETTVQMLNEQIRSLQNQILEIGKKVPASTITHYSCHRPPHHSSQNKTLARILPSSSPSGSEDPASSEGLTKEADHIISGLREELDQVCLSHLKAFIAMYDIGSRKGNTWPTTVQSRRKEKKRSQSFSR